MKFITNLATQIAGSVMAETLTNGVSYVGEKIGSLFHKQPAENITNTTAKIAENITNTVINTPTPTPTPNIVNASAADAQQIGWTEGGVKFVTDIAIRAARHIDRTSSDFCEKAANLLTNIKNFGISGKDLGTSIKDFVCSEGFLVLAGATLLIVYVTKKHRGKKEEIKVNNNQSQQKYVKYAVRQRQYAADQDKQFDENDASVSSYNSKKNSKNVNRIVAKRLEKIKVDPKKQHLLNSLSKKD